MRAQPASARIAPADADRRAPALRATRDLPGPVYFRLGKEGPPVPGLDGRFALGRADLARRRRRRRARRARQHGRGALSGGAVSCAPRASATVAVVSSFCPSPSDDIAELLDAVPLAMTLESHYLTGGLGSLVAEVIAEHGLDCGCHARRRRDAARR